MNTARVTSIRCRHSLPRRAGSIGSIRTTAPANRGPSRSTKNSTKSTSMKLTSVPIAPRNTVPPDPATVSSSRLAPVTTHASIWASVTPAVASIHSSGLASSGMRDRSSSLVRRPEVSIRLEQLRGLRRDRAGDGEIGSSSSNTTPTIVMALASLGCRRAGWRASVERRQQRSRAAPPTARAATAAPRCARPDTAAPTASSSTPTRAKKTFCDAAACGLGSVIVDSPISSRGEFIGSSVRCGSGAEPPPRDGG